MNDVKQPGLTHLVAMPLDVKQVLESPESIVTILGISLLAFTGFIRKSFVWGSLLQRMSCQAKFEEVLE